MSKQTRFDDLGMDKTGAGLDGVTQAKKDYLKQHTKLNLDGKSKAYIDSAYKTWHETELRAPVTTTGTTPASIPDPVDQSELRRQALRDAIDARNSQARKAQCNANKFGGTK